MDAGYSVILVHPLMGGLCDKCERPGYNVIICDKPRKRRRKRKKHAK